MLSEHQPYVLDCCCNCQAQAIYCDDWSKLKWVDGDPDCLHEIDYRQEPELREIDRLIVSINRRTATIKDMETIKLLTGKI